MNPASKERCLNPYKRDGALVKAGTAHELLGLNRGAFSRIQPHLLSLIISEHTYRFPLGYLEALASAIPHGSYTEARTREFAESPKAGLAITGAMISVRQKLRAAVQTRPEDDARCIPAPALQRVLDVGRVTIFDWRNQGYIETHTAGWQQPLHVDVASMEQTVYWHYPEPRVNQSTLPIV